MQQRTFHCALLISIGVWAALVAGCQTPGRSGAEVASTSEVRPEGKDSATKTTREGLTEVEACSPRSEWCTPRPTQIPVALRRPLHLPILDPGQGCPTTRGHTYANDLFGGIALGVGPVRPLIAVRKKHDAAPALEGVLRFYPFYADRSWHSLKTLWFAAPSYRGPVLIRGRQLDGSHVTVFGEQPTIVDPLLRAGPTANGRDGFREWPGASYLRKPGCFAWQVDGLTFSNLIVFKALFDAG
jgi:hypothetical protein